MTEQGSERVGAGSKTAPFIFEGGMVAIVTTSWFSKLDDTVYMRVGISRGVPRGMAGYRKYPRLNPGPWFARVSPAEYRARYFAEILDPLDPEAVVADLVKLGDGRVPALCCWEPPTGPKWCHRGLISAWLNDTIGMQVFEIGREAEGCGWSHPKIPEQFRKRGTDLFDR